MTFHLHLTGQVQGVGFRPFVWQLARSMKLKGTVSNGADGVHIYVNADLQTVRVLTRRIRAEAPALARIQSVKLAEVEPIDFGDFTIVESQAVGQASLLLTPDLALCDACRAEISDPANRRFGYAFTTCTHCGPRYSILRRLPYDRPTTTMAPFGMCADCEREYHDPSNRRFYAQTNSCPNCLVELSLFLASGQCITRDQSNIIQQSIDVLASGRTIAVKGIGGFLLLCDATNADAIHQLRERKHRPTKPLAVLYPNIDQLQQDCFLADDERALLTSPASPIVALDKRPELPSGLVADQIAPGLNQLGVMLPYTPLLALLADAFGKPLVATSGNRSGSPICYTNEQALDQLSAVADLIVTHNRDIVVPQDDSVVRLSPVFRQPIILRRSRGLAPTVMMTDIPHSNANVLALGASLKSTFAWQLRGNTYVSQYLGDLESYDTQTSFRATLDHFLTLFDAKPDAVLADQHEGYFSTQLAHELANIWGIPLVSIQHHEAHLAAVLAENKLMEQAEPVLGVIWDGTGYGTDGQIWGGEFIKYQHGGFERVGHFAYFDALLGDKMPREPRLSALSLAFNIPGADELLRPKFTEKEWNLYTKVGVQNKLKTSSVGRLFDAVAALLGLADKVSYEGEAALLLESCAARYVRVNGYTTSQHYLPETLLKAQVPTQAIVAGVVNDLQAGLPVGQIAATFHYTLVQAVAAVARQMGVQQLAFSGGVFQNALLVDWLRYELEPAYQLHFHQQLSPNDECISFGQIAQYTLITTNTVHVKTETAHVLSHSR
ncbi:carbamoyltransferase HypF [Spirosoma linguale]|uniref:Carbamoyltransferase n=1 Tax=Spirosoma linguale (strain ATCC 33905 / DSM 74 / LMG 10896 / Claus 1) TaxID=504472 RepID=D2QHS1_SPILD|nr:(NiFe) hydrogenase maturation protein HypF [Spirosoma linguale DSM 74]